MHKQNSKLITYGFLTCLFSIALPLQTWAQISFLPTKDSTGHKIVHEIDAGSSISGEINLKNTTDQIQTVDISASDGMKTNTGTFTTKYKSNQNTLLGAWITLEQNEITLQPQESRIIKYTIKVPQKTTPGSYSAGIAVMVLPGLTKPQGAGASVVLRNVYPVFVNIPGEKKNEYLLQNFSLNMVENPILNVKFRNSGNTTLKVYGNIDIINSQNVVIKNFPLDLTALRDDTLSLSYVWKDSPVVGFYKARINIEVKEKDFINNKEIPLGNETRDLDFSIIPWNYVFVVIIILILIASYIALKYYLNKRYIKKCNSYTIQENDTLINLAKAYGASWKKLAGINHLKPPYELKKGSKILLPPKNAKNSD